MCGSAEAADDGHLRIAVDYTAAIHQRAGIGRYVRELARALAISLPAGWGTPLRLFVAGARGIRLPPAPAGCLYATSSLSERMHARLWHRLRLPLPVELWTGRLHLFHATDFALPPTLPIAQTVLTVHDLAFERYPQDTMPGMLRYLHRVVPRSVRRADCVIVPSEATRRDLINLYGAPSHKVRLVYPGVEERFCPTGDAAEAAALRARYRLPDAPLVLTVGTLQPRKNHLRLVQALARIADRAALVIAGGRGWGYESVHEEIGRLGLEGRVTFTGFVDDADLPALYRMATVFVYPALYEGFGLPVLEAMACGVPVVASNVSSLPEVTGPDAALLVDPHDVESIAAALRRLLDEADLRQTLRQRGLARAAAFSWQRTAAQVWALYAELLGL